jgi:hypothetical protein
MRVANPQAADGPAGGWQPEGRIVMTPQLPPNDNPLSVCLIMATASCLFPSSRKTFLYPPSFDLLYLVR